MVKTQIERLQKDSEEIDAHIKELSMAGDTDRAEIFILKRQYLEDRLSGLVTT